eukprot:Skav232364  [mRNA]  locus=scaffold1062:301852:305054:- [translate_table: standard]
MVGCWPDDAAPVAEHLQGLEPIRWASRAHRPQGEWEERMFDDGFSDLEGLDDQEDVTGRRSPHVLAIW